jgi:uncharacterized protein with von Willebrand factor type A (vWA) domain
VKLHHNLPESASAHLVHTRVKAGADPLPPNNMAVFRQLSLRWLTARFHDGTPAGSLLAFAWDNVAYAQSLSRPLQANIRLLQHPLPAALSARLAAHFPRGRTMGLTRSMCVSRSGVGPACSPVAQRLRQVKEKHLYLATRLLAQAYQHLWLVRSHDVYQQFTLH